MAASAGPRGGTGLSRHRQHGVAGRGRRFRAVHRDRAAGRERVADALGSRPSPGARGRAARAAGVTRLGEAAVRLAAGASAEDAAQASPVESGAPSGSRAVAAEREPAERDLAGQLIAAASTAARQWGNTTPATDTLISAAASIGARRDTTAAQRAVLGQINWETAPPVGRSTEDAGLRHRCLIEKRAAADERHRQALGEWSALPRRRRWMTRRPERESPGPPSAKKSRSLVESCSGSSGPPWPPSSSGSCRGRDRPRSPPIPRRSTPCGATTRPRRLRRHSGAMARSSAPPRGSGRFGSRAGTRRPGRRRQRRRPGARRRATGAMNRTSDPTTHAPVGEPFKPADGERAPAGAPSRPPGIRRIGGHRWGRGQRDDRPIM